MLTISDPAYDLFYAHFHNYMTSCSVCAEASVFDPLLFDRCSRLFDCSAAACIGRYYILICTDAKFYTWPRVCVCVFVGNESLVWIRSVSTTLKFGDNDRAMCYFSFGIISLNKNACICFNIQIRVFRTYLF